MDTSLLVLIATSTAVLVVGIWLALTTGLFLLAIVVGMVQTRRYLRRLSPEARQLLAVRQRQLARRARQPVA